MPGPSTVRPAEPAPASTPTRVRPAEPAPVPPGQVSRVPEGGVATGGGDTAADAGWSAGLVALGGVGLAGAVAAVALRRRSTRG